MDPDYGWASPTGAPGVGKGMVAECVLQSADGNKAHVDGDSLGSYLPVDYPPSRLELILQCMLACAPIYESVGTELLVLSYAVSSQEALDTLVHSLNPRFEVCIVGLVADPSVIGQRGRRRDSTEPSTQYEDMIAASDVATRTLRDCDTDVVASPLERCAASY
jgi:hypothetical protein